MYPLSEEARSKKSHGIDINSHTGRSIKKYSHDIQRLSYTKNEDSILQLSIRMIGFDDSGGWFRVMDDEKINSYKIRCECDLGKDMVEQYAFHHKLSIQNYDK